jgi:transposase-like protein
MRGRYTPYTPELAADVCGRVRSGQNLARIAREPGMPGRSTFTLWLAEKPEFRALYQAAQSQADGDIRGGPKLERLPPDLRRGYTRAKAEAVCARIAAGASMNQIAQDHGVPGVVAIYGWLNQHEEFRRMYLAASEARADRLADEATAIADDPTGDVLRDRLRIDIRKWRVAVMEPRRHGRQAIDEGQPPVHLRGGAGAARVGAVALPRRRGGRGGRRRGGRGRRRQLRLGDRADRLGPGGVDRQVAGEQADVLAVDIDHHGGRAVGGLAELRDGPDRGAGAVLHRHAALQADAGGLRGGSGRGGGSGAGGGRRLRLGEAGGERQCGADEKGFLHERDLRWAAPPMQV